MVEVNGCSRDVVLFCARQYIWHGEQAMTCSRFFDIHDWSFDFLALVLSEPD